MRISVKSCLFVAAIGAIIGGYFGWPLGILATFDNPVFMVGLITGAVGAVSGFLLCLGFSLLFRLLINGRGVVWGFIYGTIAGGIAGAASNFLTTLATIQATGSHLALSDLKNFQFALFAIVSGLVIGVITSLILMAVYGSHLKESSIIQSSTSELSTKSRLAATLFALFLGIFGAHRFYAGKIITAVTMLSLTIIGIALSSVVSFSLPVGWLIPLPVGWFISLPIWLWAIIDFVLAVAGTMTDRNGKFIKKWLSLNNHGIVEG